ncbi:MAG: sulfotransferase [Pseudonocardiales bacterium]
MPVPVTVVFLGGVGRSGSTLLSRVLDRVPGFVSVGEACNLWNQGVINNRTCGCGRPFDACPFWLSVGEEAFGGWKRADPQAVNAQRLRVERIRRLPLMIAPQLSSAYARDFKEFADVTTRVYGAISRVSGDAVVVDNSKKPSMAFLLHHLDAIDLRVVHLVRSPYGVAHSWAKRVERPDTDQEEEMQRLSVTSSSVRWMTVNALFEALRRAGVPTLRLRYEDFVAAPRTRLEGILDFLGERRRPDELGFVDNQSADLSGDHSVWGNPMRLRVGREAMRLDDEWQRRMTPQDRRLVTALTGPGQLLYGYRGR